MLLVPVDKVLLGRWQLEAPLSLHGPIRFILGRLACCRHGVALYQFRSGLIILIVFFLKVNSLNLFNGLLFTICPRALCIECGQLRLDMFFNHV